ncbi:DNA polymerase III subunit alpha [Candidatus Falkowbacteria bacterium RIFOXYC2_FULL_48_21]|uniref:DNA polymerase III subunit alpha n=1 Tax=Candidatus Falkowbacteria bacterium RIFOXYC2_FULL_48_21 TaxID=1798005 RepID=A0A1F5T8U7_9BACT|nr:MAG: DNA polymerase III subunit alpha [Candidatus Falkowbacteria bacterium RIFOXYC2_FULL_48_21]
MKYTPLHIHSHYSLLDGLTKIGDLVDKVKADGMTAVALTDHGVMYGAIEFYQKCKAAGVKPIVGCEMYIVENRKRKEAGEDDRFHIILLAKDYVGYQNLIKLTTIAHLEGFYYKPRIDWELLNQYHEGIICLTACLAGEIPRNILRGGSEAKIEGLLNKYIGVFGKENFFLEVQHHPNIPEQKVVNNRLYDIGKRLNIPIVATTDSHYLNSEDAEAHDILICLQTKKTLADKDRMSYMGEDFSVPTSAQMEDRFRDHLEVLENTNKVAEMCNLEIPLGKLQLPVYEVPEGITDFDYLKNMCVENVKRRYGFDPFAAELSEKNRKVLDRMNYELGVIQKTGYASYFLIVQDFINWAKNTGIVVGPGRGSAAGSVISYLLNITNLEPMAYDLLFERFLNPDRISMPDIDTDFADERREEVLRYVENKYGKDHVAQIITFGTMAARAAVKDVGRVLDMPYNFCDQLSKLIPMGVDLDEALTSVVEVKQMYDTNDDAKRLLNFAKKLEGVARHASTHACGVVITREPVDHYCPCQYARDQEAAIISQYSLHPVEDLGILKMDFLGLKNLTILEKACEIVEKMHGVKIKVDDLKLDDKKTYELFQRGETTGVFQFESSGMKRYLKMLKPSVFEDLIAMVALYRPGPLNSGMVDEFIARKHGQKEITYLHPVMANSLKNTYGVIVYQEQVMQLSKDMAGFTGGQADTLRKAMGKKIAALMEKMKAEFLAGCAKNNISAEIATATFGSMEKFAEYGFNKSHAACYALIAYQTGYLKANYPTEFMAALLTSDQHNMDRITIEIDECKQMGIKIFAPSINESYSTFTVVAESLAAQEPRIRFGLNAVRNVGEAVAKSIIHERKERGVYNDLESFLSRLGGQMINKKSLEGLIKSGAMDMFGRRSQLLDNVEKMTLFTKESESTKSSKQVNLFSLNNDTNALPRLVLRESSDFGIAQILAWEKEFLGLYVSEHPFTPFARALQNLIMPLGTLFTETITKRVVRIGGVVSTIKKITTKKGEPMLFVTLEDHVHSVECLVFPRLYKAKESVWQKGTIVVTEGTLSDKDGEAKVLCNKVWELNNDNLDQVAAAIKKSALEGGVMTPGGGQRVHKRQVIISYPLGASKEFASQVKMLFMDMPGDHQVIFQIQDKMIKTNFLINLNDDNRFKLEKILGPDSLRQE